MAPPCELCSVITDGVVDGSLTAQLAEVRPRLSEFDSVAQLLADGWRDLLAAEQSVGGAAQRSRTLVVAHAVVERIDPSLADRGLHRRTAPRLPSGGAAAGEGALFQREAALAVAGQPDAALQTVQHGSSALRVVGGVYPFLTHLSTVERGAPDEFAPGRHHSALDHQTVVGRRDLGQFVADAVSCEMTS